MIVVGYRFSSFTSKEGREIKGCNLYLIYPLEKGKGEGQGTDRVYLTEERLHECGYDPAVGDDVKVEYNRFGKCAGIEVLSD